MKLKELAAKPQLIQITIDDPAIVERYGEAVEFYVYDRQPMDTYMRLSQAESGTVDEIANTILPLVLDETGKPAIDPSEQLPLDIVIKVIESVASTMGNLASQTTAA
jgi:hypothetical protein